MFFWVSNSSNGINQRTHRYSRLFSLEINGLINVVFYAFHRLSAQDYCDINVPAFSNWLEDDQVIRWTASEVCRVHNYQREIISLFQKLSVVVKFRTVYNRMIWASILSKEYMRFYSIWWTRNYFWCSTTSFQSALIAT